MFFTLKKEINFRVKNQKKSNPANTIKNPSAKPVKTCLGVCAPKYNLEAPNSPLSNTHIINHGVMLTPRRNASIGNSPTIPPMAVKCALIFHDTEITPVMNTNAPEKRIKPR